MPSTRYVLLRAGKGFLPGLLVGIVWALWTVRRRRPGTGRAAKARIAGRHSRGRGALRPVG